MWLEEFEGQINDAFNTSNHLEEISVYSNVIRLRILNRNILVDFLPGTKASINTVLAKTPVTITYENELAAFRNHVNHNFLP